METLEGRIAVALEGEALDLDDACTLFSGGGDLSIARVHIPPNDKVVLLSDDLDGLEDDDQIFSRATRLIDFVNGVLFLEDTNRVPITPQGIVHRQAANGQWGVTIRATGTASGRSRMRASSGPPSRPSPQSILVQNATRQEMIGDVFTHLRSTPEWFDLYKAFELMRSDIDKRLGKNGRALIGWPGKPKISHFTKSAQVYRHAKSDWPHDITPETAMAIGEARSFIQNLCKLWVQSFSTVSAKTAAST